MTLVAHDEANNEGKSEPREFALPQRVFVKPVARALIEQRRCWRSTPTPSRWC